MHDSRLEVIRVVAAVTAAIAALALTVAVIILGSTVGEQQDRLAHQSLELECRGDLAAQGDILRNDIILWVSRGLRATVAGDQQAVTTATVELDKLDTQLEDHNRDRERTLAICAED